MTIRPYLPGDRAALYDICLRTGDSGRDATRLYADPALLGEIYVGPYLEYEPELAYVVADEDGVAGYVLGARDTAAFEDECERSWWPPLRRRYPAAKFTAGTTGSRLVQLVHKPPRTDASVVRGYPAHMHIDLLPRMQGQGVGAALLQTLFRALRLRGAPGLHLGVGAANARAIGFYEHIGFRTLSRTDAVLVMGISLTKPASARRKAS